MQITNDTDIKCLHLFQETVLKSDKIRRTSDVAKFLNDFCVYYAKIADKGYRHDMFDEG